jgi:hypothetical protein
MLNNHFRLAANNNDAMQMPEIFPQASRNAILPVSVIFKGIGNVVVQMGINKKQFAQ